MDCNIQGSPEPKKPCKGILKTSSSFDKHSVSQRRKSTKFDEINVMQTYHPADKDYGHMKIDEPKTPYNYADSEESGVDQLDADELTERLRKTEGRRSLSSEADSSDDEFSNETEEERKRRLEFQRRRKAHYNEFEAVRLARKLIEEEDDVDEDANDGNESKTIKSKDTPSTSDKCQIGDSDVGACSEEMTNEQS